MHKILALLFEVSLSTVYKHKNKLIYMFIEKYFDKNDILEYIETGRMKKLDLIENYSIEEIEKYLPKKSYFNKDILTLKKVNLRVLYVFLKYANLNANQTFESSLDAFILEYTTKLKFSTAIKDDVILFKHHFQEFKKVYNEMFTEEDFQNIVIYKKIILEILKDKLK